MSETPGIISLGQHNAGEFEGGPGNLIGTKKNLKDSQKF